ncbi:DNA-binding protein [Weissella paramesenteroides]|uniref:DNA-binding protein n=1 Tax=Weissella paramesenteroides TaxID=1249 RepID=UPI00223A756E|nr:DNA-binding protein [Weissella paramesenteroides]MCS9983767.1 DNA-binding protein [Weissella paramesenteroides]MCS9997901.1 DNA-binding protein [Weissella paramesenteroides]MCT0260119.1 DNA-binding protein [Weissella paramesenteroides]
MSENLKTIRELADEFKVSKQAVRKRLTDEFRANYVETVYSNGVETLVVTVSGYRLLKQHFSGSNGSENVGSNVGGNGGNDNVTSDNKQTTDNSYVFKILEQQLAVKDKQIENKDSQITQMQNLLDQQQRLALQDKQLLEEYKAEIKDLKSLTMAPHDDGEKEVTSDKQPEPENSTPESQPKPKKWWRFGK